jgi:transposase
MKRGRVALRCSGRSRQRGPVICEVIAPALIPRKPGERIKTDRRDARKLAELLRAGLLTEVQAPTPEQEAGRDLCRAREDAKEDLLRCRHRLGKLLLRRGLVYSGGKQAWTHAHRKWLRSVKFDHATDQAVLSDYLLAIEQVEQRVQTLEQQLTAAAESEPLREPVGWLRCFRGIDTVTAVTLVAELHGIERFSSPRQLMAYIGLVPSEHSSSERTRRGGITKAGNSHARRVLIYRHPPRVSAGLTERRAGQPAAVIAIADKTQHRLYRRRRPTRRESPQIAAPHTRARAHGRCGRAPVGFGQGACPPVLRAVRGRSTSTGARARPSPRCRWSRSRYPDTSGARSPGSRPDCQCTNSWCGTSPSLPHTPW